MTVLMTCLTQLACLGKKTDVPPSDEQHDDLRSDLVEIGKGERASSPAIDRKRFRDHRHGYHVDYPHGWHLKDKSRGSHMIRADLTSPNGKYGFQIRRYRRGKLNFSDFVDSYLQRFKKDMGRHWKGTFSDEAIGFAPIGVHEGCKASFTLRRSDGQSWCFIEYLWQDDEQVIAFQCGIPSEEQDSLEVLFDEMAKSFRF